MALFKCSAGNIYGFEDNIDISQDAQGNYQFKTKDGLPVDVPAGLQPFIAPPVLPPTPDELAAQSKAQIQLQIDGMEREQMLPRVVREGLLAIAINTALGSGLSETQLYQQNIAYRKMKDFDNLIAGLRAQL
jgi:hypothetical protein